MLIIAFILGATCVSFAMCQATRFIDQTLTARHSVCDHCHQRLKWWQLIPFLGYLFQAGKCINCHFPISIMYPIGEFLGGIFFVYLFLFFSIWPAIQFCFLLTWLLILALEDFFTETVSLKLLLIGSCSVLLIFIDRIFNIHLIQIELWIIICGSLAILSLNDYFGWADTCLISLFGILFTPVNLATIILIASCGAFITLKLSNQSILPFIPWLLIGVIVILSLNPLFPLQFNPF